MSDNLFTVKQASEVTDVSRQSIRTYTNLYAKFFSTEATPEQGERKFTRDDLKLITYISASTAFRQTHDEIIKGLERGDMELFRWEPPDAPPKPTERVTEPRQDAPQPLVPMAQLQAAQALMLDAQAREKDARERIEEIQQQAREREQQLQDRIEQMAREMGKLEGELSAIKTPKPKGLWARLFSG